MYLKIRLSWKTWKALFIELVSVFYSIYFLLLLVIWLSVEKMFSTEPIVAFLDLCSCYIFWLHLWVNTNLVGCLKYVYNMIVSIYRSIYSCIEWNRIVEFLEVSQISYCCVWESISYWIAKNHPIYTPNRYMYIQYIYIHKKKLWYIALKVVIWLVIKGEPLLVLYTASTKSWYFSGSSPVLWQRYHIQNLLSSCMVLQQFFSCYLGYLPVMLL